MSWDLAALAEFWSFTNSTVKLFDRQRLQIPVLSNTLFVKTHQRILFLPLMALQKNILKQILLRQSRKQLNGLMMKIVLSPVFDPPAQSLDPFIIILSPRLVLCVKDYEGVCGRVRGNLKWCVLTLMITHRYRLTTEFISRLLHSCQRKWSVQLETLFFYHLWPRWEPWSWKGILERAWSIFHVEQRLHWLLCY